MIFCERQEESEGFDDKASPSKKKKDTRHKSDTRSSTDKSSNGNQKAKHYCKNHGPNNTHDTKDCRTKDGQTSNYNSNKIWKRSDYSKNSDSKKEMAAIENRSRTGTVMTS